MFLNPPNIFSHTFLCLKQKKLIRVKNKISQICGGHLAVSVYTTGLAPDSENNDVSEPDMDKAPETEAVGAEYLGCFEDSKDNHIMKIGFVDDNMTNEVNK